MLILLIILICLFKIHIECGTAKQILGAFGWGSHPNKIVHYHVTECWQEWGWHCWKQADTDTELPVRLCVAAGKMAIPYLFSDCKPKTSIVAESESFSHLKMFLFLSVSCCPSVFEKKKLNQQNNNIKGKELRHCYTHAKKSSVLWSEILHVALCWRWACLHYMCL